MAEAGCEGVKHDSAFKLHSNDLLALAIKACNEGDALVKRRSSHAERKPNVDAIAAVLEQISGWRTPPPPDDCTGGTLLRLPAQQVSWGRGGSARSCVRLRLRAFGMERRKCAREVASSMITRTLGSVDGRAASTGGYSGDSRNELIRLKGCWTQDGLLRLAAFRNEAS
eukprot:3054968-Pleurochrysis_carterae.AAC.2